jgi:hypothetical protein
VTKPVTIPVVVDAAADAGFRNASKAATNFSISVEELAERNSDPQLVE